MLARKLLMASIGGGAFVIPSFTGSYSLFGDEQKGYIELYTSGTLTFDGNSTVDVFILGSGLHGGDGYQASGTSTTIEKGGDGGAGGKGETYTGIKVSGSYDITIAAACSSTLKANASSAFGNSVNTKGASGGYGADRSNAVNGSTGVSIPFGDGVNFPSTYGGGGGGGGGSYTDGYTTNYQPGSGGIIGGGKGAFTSAAVAGTANTGGGGGGGRGSDRRRHSANGGSGLVIVRWGY